MISSTVIAGHVNTIIASSGEEMFRHADGARIRPLACMLSSVHLSNEIGNELNCNSTEFGKNYQKTATQTEISPTKFTCIWLGARVYPHMKSHRMKGSCFTSTNIALYSSLIRMD